MKNRKVKKQENIQPGCRTLRTWLFDYVCKTGELAPDSLAFVKKHLAACSNCSKTAGTIKTVAGILRGIPRVTDDTPSCLSPERRRKILKSLKDKA